MNYFAKLFINKSWVKAISIILTTGLLVSGGFLIYQVAFAAVSITPATNGENISIDTTSATGGSGTFIGLDGPAITETAPGDISVGTHTLTLPAGWEFNTATIDILKFGGNIVLQGNSISVSQGDTSFSFTVNEASTNISTLGFMNLSVRPITQSPSTGNITHSGDAISGVTNGTTGFGTLTTVAGTPTQLSIETQADGDGTVISAQNLTSGSSLTVYAIERDQFDNFSGNVTATWSLANQSPSPGGIVPSDLSTGNGASTILTGNLVGAASLNASANTRDVNSGSINVIPGAVNVGTSVVIVDKDSETASSGGNVITATVTVKDAAGNVIPNSNVTVSSTGSNNTINPVPATTNASGIATVTLFSTKAEAKTISASADSTAITQTQSVTFIPDVANRIEMKTQPSDSAIAGVNFTTQPAVNIVDQFSNLIISNDETSIVTAARNPATGSQTLYGTLTATAVDGVATFTDLSYQEAATIKINFSSGDLTLTTSDDIAVSPNIPATATFTTQPSNSGGTVDNILSTQPVVKIVDAYGNNVAATDVTLSKATGTGALLGTLVKTTSNGTATFDNIGYNKTDGFTITATAGAASATSEAISALSAGIINSFTLSAGTSQVAGTPFSVSVSGAIDQHENAASGEVTVSAFSGGGNSPSSNTPTYGAITVGIEGSGSANTTLVNAVDTVLHGLVGSILDDTDSITVSAGAQTQITLTSDKDDIAANGTETATITAQLKDAYGNNAPVVGVNITFSTIKGEVSPTDAVATNAIGVSSATLTSGADRTSGTADVNATSGDLTVTGVSVTMNDVTAPDAPVITTPASSPVVINIANKEGQALSGTAEANSTIKIYVGGEATSVTTTATDGTFVFTNHQLQTAGIVSETDYPVAKVVTVKATDVATNESAASNSIFYTQDTAAPSITTYDKTNTIFSPNSDSSKDTTSLDLVFSEVSVVYDINILEDGEDKVKDLADGNAQNSGEKIWDGKNNSDATVGDGTYTVQVIMTDPAGNSATDISYNNVQVDTVTPTVALTYSANPAKAGIMTVTATYSEPIIGTPQISIDQQGTTDVNTQNMTVTTESNNKIWTYSYSVNTDNAGASVDGDATVSLSAITDEGGNTANDPTNTTFTIDTSAPTSSITSPAAEDVVKDTDGNVSLAFVSTGGSICEYSVNGESYIALDSCTSPKTITLTDGRKSVVLKVTDSADNSTESSAVSFVVDTNNDLAVGATGADFTTIQAAINAATVDDTISVAAGTYTENVNVNKSVTLAGASSATVTVNAENAGLSVFNVTADSVDISGFTVSGTITDGHAGIYFVPGVTDCNIHDNIVTGNIYGILLNDVEDSVIPGNNTFASNTVSNNTVSGIEMQHTYGNTFTNNIANSNGRYGFALDSARNNTFTGNTANSNSREGFWLKQGSGIVGSNHNTFTNNTANLNTRSGMHMTNLCGYSTYTGNTFDSNGIAGMNLGGTTGDTTNNLTVNNNSFSGNPIGVAIQAGAIINSVVFHNNIIIKNTNYGISNLGTGNLSATQNYWDSIKGPTVDSNPHGDGDSIIGTVTYVSWCTEADCDPYDTTAPTATLTDTPANLTNVTTTEITVGGEGVVYYKYNLDSAGYGAETSVANHISLSGLNGSYTILVIGRDQAGNWQTEGSAISHIWTVDSVVPTLTTVTIASNNANNTALAKVGDTITLTFIGSENLTANPVVTIRGQVATVHTGTDAAHWTATYVMASGDTEGVVPFTINFTDIATNAGTEVNATIGGSSITFDRTAPTASEVTPVVALANDATPDVVINVESDVAWQIKDGDSVLNSETGNGSEQTVEIASLSDETYNLTLTATDAAGNQTSISLTQFVIDATVPTLTLNSSFTGMTLTGGNIYPITWTASDLHLGDTPIVLEYSTNGGSTWNSIGSATANDSTENWTVPSTNSANCKIRITATDLATNTDNVEGGTFTITYSTATDTTAPVATLNSPNGGETWENNAAHIITWTATDNITAAGSLDIKLEYSTNGGDSWTTIIEDTDNDGAYSWTPTETTSDLSSTNVLVKVTATDDTSLTGSDISNNVLVIATPVAYPTSICNGNGTSCTITLSTGWNLVSLPIIPTNTDIATVLSGKSGDGIVKIVKYYDSTESNDWKSYVPDEGGNLSTIEDGKGYWINMDNSATLTVTGTSAPVTTNPPSTYNVISGWNLIGYKSLTAYKNSSTYLSTIPSGFMVFDQNNTDKTSSYLQHGKGYWLWSTGTGSFVAAD